MKKTAATLAIMLLVFIPTAGTQAADRTEYILRTTGTLSLPVSPFISRYLEPGFGGGLSLLVRRHFWPMQMEFEAGYIGHPLKGSDNGFFRIIPLTLGLHYNLPFRIAGRIAVSLFARSGLALEFLGQDGSTDVNTAFTAGLGTRFTLPLSSGADIGLSLQYMMLTEKDESASFFHTRIHLDLKL